MALYREDIVDIDLVGGSIHRSFMMRSIGKADIMENRFGVRLFRNGEPENIGTGSCTGLFMAPNGQNILITGSGSTGVSGNMAWVQLPQACYNEEGQFALVIKISDGSVTGTMRIVDGVVDNTGSDSPVAPTGTVPTYEQVLEVYDQMVEAVAETESVKDAIRTSGSDLGAFFSHNDTSYAGVTFEWDNAKKMWHVSGTASANTGVNLFVSTNSLPFGIKAGEKYRIEYEASNVYFEVWDYSGGSASGLLSIKTSRDYKIPAGMTGMIVRLYVYSGATVDEWVNPEIYPITTAGMSKLVPMFMGVASKLSDETNLNNYTKSGRYTIDCEDMTNTPISSGIGVFDVLNYGSIITQEIVFRTGLTYFRAKVGSSAWGDWIKVFQDKTDMTRTGTKVSVDLNTLSETQYCFVDESCTNKPDGTYNGFLMVYEMTVPNGIVLQQFINYSDKAIYQRSRFSGLWGNWVEIIGGGGGDIYNTYNITTSPQITTDDHNWIQAVDDETTTEENATDMTGAIMSMLTDTGYCKLSPGVFYVSGNIDMPAGSCISGCGKNTVIRLLSSVTNGYIIKAINNCTIEDMTLSGGKNAPTFSETTTRHGIYFARAQGDTSTVKHCLLSNLFIENFTGSGIYCSRTGGGVRENIIAENIAIDACKTGINIAYHSEYHKFTNVVMYGCNTACVNNGGNNVFTACTFHGNTGFVIDNSNSDLENPGHGSCIGCTFNHIGGNTGKAVVMKRNTVTFIFDGCQMWYGALDIQASKGIIFNAVSFGGVDSPQFNLVNNTTVLFTNCTFYSAPTITKSGNTSLMFDNCYLSATGEQVTG